MNPERSLELRGELEAPQRIEPEARERDVRADELRRQAQGTFGAIKGRRGASNEEYWQEVVARAKLDYDSGNFLLGRLGGCRQLDLPLVAILLQLRQDLPWLYGFAHEIHIQCLCGVEPAAGQNVTILHHRLFVLQE